MIVNKFCTKKSPRFLSATKLCFRDNISSRVSRKDAFERIKIAFATQCATTCREKSVFDSAISHKTTATIRFNQFTLYE